MRNKDGGDSVILHLHGTFGCFFFPHCCRKVNRSPRYGLRRHRCTREPQIFDELWIVRQRVQQSERNEQINKQQQDESEISVDAAVPLCQVVSLLLGCVIDTWRSLCHGSFTNVCQVERWYTPSAGHRLFDTKCLQEKPF